MTENNGKSHEISTNQMTSGEIGRNNRESPSNFELEESLNNILSRSHHKSKYNTAMASERYYRVLIIHGPYTGHTLGHFMRFHVMPEYSRK